MSSKPGKRETSLNVVFFYFSEGKKGMLDQWGLYLPTGKYDVPQPKMKEMYSLIDKGKTGRKALKVFMEELISSYPFPDDLENWDVKIGYCPSK